MDTEEFDLLLELAADKARTEWEERFVSDLNERRKNPFWEATERQWEKLQEIAERDESF